MRTPGSSAGARTWKVSRCAHLDGQQVRAPVGLAGAHQSAWCLFIQEFILTSWRVLESWRQAQLEKSSPCIKSPGQSYNTLRHGQSQCQDKEFLIKECREQPNLESLDTIMPHIYAMQSVEAARCATERKERIQAVGEEIDCRMCGKKHNKKIMQI